MSDEMTELLKYYFKIAMQKGTFKPNKYQSYASYTVELSIPPEKFKILQKEILQED